MLLCGMYKTSMTEEPDYYAVLQVSPDADEETIKLAFRRLARQYHPDVAGTGSLERMQQLNLAYQTLSDGERRRQYDARRPAPVVQSDSSGLQPRPSAAGSTSTHQPQRGERSRHTRRTGTVSATSGPLRLVTVLMTPEEAPVAAVAFTEDALHTAIGLIDGNVHVWDVAARRLTIRLAFHGHNAAGALQELRFSPGGAYAMAWGFQLGARVWQVSHGKVVWSTGISGPSGAVDAALFDTPAAVRLALPDAPISLADEDPFKWAFAGRAGSAVMTRPLVGKIDAAAALPLRCVESPTASRYGTAGDLWRVQARVLARDGHSLMTFSSTQTDRIPEARVIHVWDLEHTSLLGNQQPRRKGQVVRRREEAQLPLIATPDLSWCAFGVPDVGVELVRISENERRIVRVGDIGTQGRIALSPNGEFVAVARNSQLDLWETRENKLVQRWQLASEITAIQFAPGRARVLAIGLRNGLVEVWT